MYVTQFDYHSVYKDALIEIWHAHLWKKQKHPYTCTHTQTVHSVPINLVMHTTEIIEKQLLVKNVVAKEILYQI